MDLYLISSKLRAFLRFVTAPLWDHERSLEHHLERVERECDRWRERDAGDERRFEEACERGSESPERSSVRDSMSHLQSDQILTGRVTEIHSHEIDVDIDGVECPVRIPESSWEDIGHPTELLSLGKEVYVKVLSAPSDALHPFLVLISMRQARRELDA